MFNLGGPGWIEADGVRYELDFEDCLYITKGTEKVTFGSNDSARPARFYLVSAPAHKVCKTTFISIKDANKRPCGSSNYTFIWAMGGENQAFDDMDNFAINELR